MFWFCCGFENASTIAVDYRDRHFPMMTQNNDNNLTLASNVSRLVLVIVD